MRIRRVYLLMNLIQDENSFIKEVKYEIKKLEIKIQKFHKISNNEIIWLFAATVGCWGIPNEHPIFQLVAFIISFLIFVTRVIEKVGEPKPFTVAIASIKNNLTLKMSMDSDFVKARLFDLQEIENKYLSRMGLIKENKVFFMCWMFCGLSLMTIISEFPSKL